MEVKINIEKKHLWIISVVIVLVGAALLAIAQTAPSASGAWHPLQLVATDSSGSSSVDEDNNRVIDQADYATKAMGIHVIDDAEETYDITLQRYHITLTGENYDKKSKRIPQDVLEDLCGDFDGCEVRIGMRMWNSDTNTETASRSNLFYYNPSDHRWRADNDQYGIDGDGVSKHVIWPWNQCYLTDGEYDGNGDAADGDEIGMNFLMWNTYKASGRSCELTLID